MSIYLDEKNPEKHKPFDDASPDIVAYVRYLEVIAGKSPNTAFSYYCDLRNFSRFMKQCILNYHQFDVSLETQSSQRACISSVHSSGIYQIEVTVFLNCSSNLLNNRTFIFLSHYYSVLLDFFYRFRVNLDTRTHRARKINTLDICTLGCGRFQFIQSRDEFFRIVANLISTK